MKKLALLLLSVVLFASCNIDDDGPQMMYVPAEVVSADFPDFFELDEQHEIEVTYALPTACHDAAGLNLGQGEGEDEIRDIYISGVVRQEVNAGECAETSENLERVESFFITIKQEEPYTFYLWTGVDENDEPIYEVVEVPVGEPDAGEEEEEPAPETGTETE